MVIGFFICFFNIAILYFLGHFGFIFSIIASLIFVFNFFLGNIKHKVLKYEFFCILFLFINFLFSVIVYFNSDQDVRPLFFYNIMGLLSFLFLINIKVDNIFKVISFVFLFEVFVVFLQFLNLNFGYGLELKNKIDLFAPEGTLLNSNNSSVFIFSMCLILTSYFSYKKKNIMVLIILFLTFFSVFVTMSRTILVLYCLYLIFFIIDNIKFSIKRISYIFGIFSFFSLFFVNIKGEWLLFFERSINKMFTLSSMNLDDSSSARLISLERWFDNLLYLGFGTLKDGSYGVYYESFDLPLLSFNPHVYIVEISFLYGYIGVLFAFSLYLLVFYSIFSTKINLILKILIFSFFIIMQAVPSSILHNYMFFIVFLSFYYLRNIQVESKV